MQKAKAKPLKVWGMVLPGRKFVQVRAVVAATSQKEAAAAFGVSLYEFRNYACETGNREEIAAAMSKRGCVFSKPLDGHGVPYMEGRQ